MMKIKRVAAGLGLALALAAVFAQPAEARTRRGDRYYAQGQRAEREKDFEKALEAYQKALDEDPSDVLYLMAVRRMRFQLGQLHVDKGEKLRSEGKLEEALLEFRQALTIDPASPVAVQEIRRTMELIEREKKLPEPPPPEERGLTAAERARREASRRLAEVMSVPTLKPLSPSLMTFKANNQPPRVIIETICKLAGINVIFDPDPAVANSLQNPRLSVEWTNITVEEALNFVATLARLFWKPISQNAIYVTADNPNKRREVEEQVTKVFYINNITGQNDLNEIRTAIQQMTGAQRVAVSQAQGAIIMRGTVDQVALAEILVRNLDRPKAEVVVDLVLMEVSRTRSQTLSAALNSAAGIGLSIPVTYSPRNAVSANSGAVRLSDLGRTSSADWSVVLPGAVLEALMKDSGVRILQAPQVRAVDGMKASLRVGDRVPYSTGGFQPAFGQIGAGTFNTLYNTFQFLDTGVTVDITPKVHADNEVTLHVELEISNVKERIEIAGISQPVVGSRRIIHDIRLREGEVNLLGGLVQSQESRSVSGIPGLSSIPVLRRLFTSEKIERSETELLIALIPRIVRTPDLDELNFKGVAVGSETTAPRLMYAPRRDPAPQEAGPAAGGAISAAPAEPPRPVGPPAVIFSPAVVEAKPGGQVTLELRVENVTDLFSAPLAVKFDPNVLQLEEVTRGSMLVADGREVIFTRNILNQSGDVKMMLRRMPGTGGISGSGVLVSLTFRVVGAGVTTVTAPNLSFQNSKGEVILTASPQASVTIR